MTSIIRFLYCCILIIIAPPLLYSLYKKKKNKPEYGKRWREHFGITPLLQVSSPVWVHAVSVGEVIAITPLIQLLKEREPSIEVLVTTTTSTGAAQAKKNMPYAHHRYMPIDFPFAVKAFIKAINPSKLIIMETELWPNTLFYTAKNKIPITVVNARLSDSSYRKYRKFPHIFKLLFNNINNILCQYHDDHERFIKLGVDPHKLHITGSMKFDITVNEDTFRLAKTLRNSLGNRPIWVAASTHRGEDEILFECQNRLLTTIPNLLLIIVPRHPERFDEVQSLARTFSLSPISRTSKSTLNDSNYVYIGDTMGEMLTLIGAADICFMGGSLLGEKVGGHNLLEPAALGIPSIIGPSFFNFTYITQQLVEKDATLIIKNEDELVEKINYLFNQPSTMKKMGQASLEVVNQNQGAIEKTLALI